jgi:hypothetical protein
MMIVKFIAVCVCVCVCVCVFIFDTRVPLPIFFSPFFMSLSSQKVSNTFPIIFPRRTSDVFQKVVSP